MNLRFLAILTSSIFGALPAFAASAWNYRLEDTDYALSSHCAGTKGCYPLKIELSRGTELLMDLEYTNGDAYSDRGDEKNRALISRLTYADWGMQGQVPTESRLYVPDPLLSLVHGPLFSAGIIPRIGDTDRHALELLEKGISVSRTVFLALVRGVWPEYRFSPEESLRFSSVSGSIRVEGRGISDPSTGRGLYLACVDTPIDAQDCVRYRFIIERNAGNERAYLGPSFAADSSRGFRPILEKRISDILNGESFRSFFVQLSPGGDFESLKPTFEYHASDEQIPGGLDQKWKILVSRDLRAWQLKPYEISTEAFDEVLDLLDMESPAAKPAPCSSWRRVSISNGDGSYGMAGISMLAGMGVSPVSRQFNHRDESVANQFVRTLLQPLACATKMPGSLGLEFEFSMRGENHVCLDWYVRGEDLAHEPVDRRVFRTCNKRWTVESLQASFRDALGKAQKVF